MDLEAKNINEMLHNSSVKAVKMLITEPVAFAFGLWILFRMVCDLSLSFGNTNHIRGVAWLERGCGRLTIYFPVHRCYHRFRCQLSPDPEIQADHESKG
jgi:hypothetical protein